MSPRKKIKVLEDCLTNVVRAHNTVKLAVCRADADVALLDMADPATAKNKLDAALGLLLVQVEQSYTELTQAAAQQPASGK